jgi:sugar lactone lactonase YvrE
LEWSGDGSRAFYVDSATGRIDAFDYTTTGGLINRRSFVEIPADAGAPDGLTIDTEDHVWVALWGGSAVHRYTPTGKLDAVIDLPVSQVTACTFGGPDLRTMYVTTSQFGVDLCQQPLAGALFAVDLDVAGRQTTPFAG